MDLDFTKIIKDKQIVHFLQNNKFDPEIINEFIKFIASQENIDYFLLRDILSSVIDTKNFTEIASIFYALLTSNPNLVDLVDVCSKLSVNIIQRFKGSPLILKILNTLVDISFILYNKGWYYECTTLLYTFSLFITNCGIYNKLLFRSYYILLTKILMRSNNFYSALNVLILIDPEFSCRRLSSICKLKNEGKRYSQFLLKANYKSFEDLEPEFDNIYDEQCDGKLEYLIVIKSHDIENYDFSFKVDYSYWIFYSNNIGNSIPFNRDNIQFISFMSKNSLNFVRKGDKVIIGEYKYQSVDSKIHDIIDLYIIKEIREMKQSNITEKIVKQSTTVTEKVTNKKRDYKFIDNFIINKAKYNIYCEILKNTYRDKVIDYYTRNSIRKKNHEKYISNLQNKKDFFMKYNGELEELLKKLFAQKKKETGFIKSEVKNNRSSWRDEPRESSTVHKSEMLRRDEIQSDRKIFTYGETEGSYNLCEGVFKPNVSAYKPNVTSQKTSESPFRPNIAPFTPKLETLKMEISNLVSSSGQNVFKSKLSENKYKEEKPYKPKTQKLASKNLYKWYDDNKK